MIKKALALVLFLFASPLWAQSPIDGTWNFTMSSPFGAVDAKVTMMTEGDKLSGEFDLGGGRKLTIEEGTVDGDNIAFSITREGAMTMTYEMSASVDGDSITGTALAMGSAAPWTMSRGS
ncbi:MAG: hypothetical protein KJN90_05965 [Gammaproteobacteria bacterium]|nr:hypothetical protein [Gammaproteobacteria bacterium]